jgi:hypothetical protein
MDVSFEDISSKSRYSEPSLFTTFSINQVANGFSCDKEKQGAAEVIQLFFVGKMDVSFV